MKQGAKNIIIGLVVLFILGAIAYYVLKRMKEAAQNLVANTPAGSLAGVRTVEAQESYQSIMKMKFLEHAWIQKANLKYNTRDYQFPERFTQDQANAIARDLFDSKAIISTDYTNDNGRAVSAIFSIKNWVQAAQVADAYYYTAGRHRNLNRGLAWLSNEAMIEVKDHLSKLTTGVWRNGVELDKSQVFV